VRSTLNAQLLFERPTFTLWIVCVAGCRYTARLHFGEPIGEALNNAVSDALNRARCPICSSPIAPIGRFHA
jgi:hypothetical protein